MAVRLIVTFKAVVGKGEQFARAFAPVIAKVRKEHGCEQYTLFRGTDDPDTLVLLERWQDQAALDAHGAAMRARGLSPTENLRAAPPVAERYEAP